MNETPRTDTEAFMLDDGQGEAVMADVARQLERELNARGMPSRADVMGAVARGWCSPNNSGKEVDAELAFAITVQIMALLEPASPN